MPSERDTAADARVCAARTRLADRMNALEQRLSGTVDWASDAVRDTMRHASDQFHQIVDVRGHIRERPWPSVGAASVVGFTAGILTGRRRQIRRPTARYSAMASNEPPSPSIWGQLLQSVKREIAALGESAIQSASAALRDNIQTAAADLKFPFGRHEHNGRHHEEYADR
jgi:ElaB/YqjD/DUF883 family membrane-anchored ribosome-binding protein